jgi:hypothetical protein
MTMKKNIARLLTFGVLSMAPVLSASTNLEVNVPFGFTAGHSTLPAGQYEISIDDSRHLICIKGSGANLSMFLLTQPAEARTVGEESRVVFLRRGDEYSLSALWVIGEKTGQEVPQAR